MYYKEEVIDGVLCAKYSPSGEFKPLTAKQLTRRLLIAESQLKNIAEQIKNFRKE